MSRKKVQGFSLMELLLVVAIIGILSAIAIPSYMSQRRRARLIGDAISNTKALAMMLENRKAETGVYGGQGNYIWSPDGSFSGPANIAPAFVAQGNTKMRYTVAIPDATGVRYTLTVDEPVGASFTEVYQTDQSGAELFRVK